VDTQTEIKPVDFDAFGKSVFQAPFKFPLNLGFMLLDPAFWAVCGVL
jgi:hypothetical protein